ncbi:lipopolysaccharide biosynthesis protein [Rhabdobacter roseus]|uniref:O-antigen/teichoic acid export membrane protein n=1 Tax=Rhabdobacter roseus TaxID=1655419 RepID=A0A840TMS0_9BACT|nr:oligosaccharide flippase family protein [Rhabdobacter roseus]MBB5284235.1 O-antigen/teichoic acid export membrane protein [Rhabdobacter roseus]
MEIYRSIKNIGWVTISSILNQAFNIGFLIYASRSITPNEYGLISIIIIIIGFSEIFINSGFVSYLIQERRVCELLYSTIFFSNLFVSLLFVLFFLATSKHLSIYFGEPVLEKLINYCTICFLFLPLRTIPLVKLNKSYNFQKISIINLTSNLISLIVAFYQLSVGYGIWAILSKLLLFQIINTTIYSLSVSWKIKLEFSWIELKKSGKYSINQTLADTIGYWSRKIDDIIIARFIGLYGLGLYSFAYNFLMLPSIMIKSQLVQVLFPTMSSIKNDTKKLNKMYIDISGALSYFGFPLIFILYIISSDLIPILVGDKWNAAIPLVHIFCIASLFEITIIPSTLFKSIGRADLNLKTMLLTKFITLTGILIGSIQGDIISISISIIISNFINFFVFSIYVKKYLGILISEVVLVNYPALLIAFPVLIIGHLIDIWNFQHPISMTLKIVIGISTWILLSLTFKPFAYLLIKEKLSNKNKL